MENSSNNPQNIGASFGNLISQLSAKQNQWFNYIALNGRLESSTDLVAAVRSAILSFCLASGKSGKAEVCEIVKTYEDCAKIISELLNPVFDYRGSFDSFSLFVNDYSGVVLQNMGNYRKLEIFAISDDKFEIVRKYLESELKG